MYIRRPSTYRRIMTHRILLGLAMPQIVAELDQAAMRCRISFGTAKLGQRGRLGRRNCQNCASPTTTRGRYWWGPCRPWQRPAVDKAPRMSSQGGRLRWKRATELDEQMSHRVVTHDFARAKKGDLAQHGPDEGCGGEADAVSLTRRRALAVEFKGSLAGLAWPWQDRFGAGREKQDTKAK